MGGLTPTLCHICFASLSEGARFCASCGERVPPQNEANLVAPSSPAPSDRGASQPSVSDTDVPATELDPLTMAGRFPPGARIAGYRIDSLIGVGGMGVVYSAWDETRGRPVAIKCLHPNLVADPEVKRRFHREARALRSLSHEGAAAIFNFIEQRDLLGIVMELVDGVTLTRHISRWRGRVPWIEVHALFGGILDAMAQAHGRGIVHRDLKPDNVLVRTQGSRVSAKIVDFGIAKIREGTTFTVTGAFIGTCRYMAPEQVKTPQLADPRSDVYSLGILLYELCTGRVPFDYSNHFAVMMAQVSEEPESPRLLRSDMPTSVETLILKALSKNPDSRPPTCVEFRKELDSAFAGILAITSAPEDLEELAPVIQDTGGHEMVLVPAGRFLMGQSRRSIFLESFYIDRLPVTNDEFATFVRATGYEPEPAGKSRFLMHTRDPVMAKKLADHPVVFVSWADARAYATWAGKRLPTEAEWEKAARGTDGRKYPWGREEPSKNRAHFGQHGGVTSSAGAFPKGASPYGALDMAGNVLEWCDDADDPDFYEKGPDHNPHSVSDKANAPRVMRGGSFLHGARALRTSARTSFEPLYRFASGGFRCARNAR